MQGPVPRAWLAVLALALVASPRRALAGIWFVLTRRRVRGWNELAEAAATHPRVHAAWVAEVEPRVLAETVRTGRQAAIEIAWLSSPDSASEVAICALPGVRSVSRDVQVPPAEWIVPLAPGDRLSPALAGALAEVGVGDIVYWDEDVGGEERHSPWFKPGWDPLLGIDGLGLIGACALRRDRVSSGFNGEWTDLLSTLVGQRAPHHLPCILTHRASAPPAPVVPAAAAPPVSTSIVIPTRDHAELLEACIASLDTTAYPGDRELVIVDNGTCEPDATRLLETLARRRDTRVIERPGPFNFAALINEGVAAATLDQVCLLNNDVVVLNPDWLTRMTDHAARDDVGAVGARLLYPDGSIQHAGVALGIGDAAGHVAKGARSAPGRAAPWYDRIRTVSAVTAACLLVSRAKFEAVGGMDAETFRIDFNDVDLCLRLNARGWRTVYCAEAVLEHRESLSRGRSRNGPERERFERELGALRARWQTVGMLDPHHSPRLRRWSEPCIAAF